MSMNVLVTRAKMWQPVPTVSKDLIALVQKDFKEKSVIRVGVIILSLICKPQ